MPRGMLTPAAALRTAALLLLVLGIARALGGVVLATAGPAAVDTTRVTPETARLLGAGLIFVGILSGVASIGCMQRRAWGWSLAFVAIALFVADGLLNGAMLFGQPGDRGTMVNVAAAALIAVCLLRGRAALRPVRLPPSPPSSTAPDPRTAPSA